MTTKAQFLEAFATMYRVANRSDSDWNAADWTKPVMAGSACCRLLDQMKREMIAAEIVTDEEMEALYADL
jgi:hypothetical protein